jgi:2-octaprenyl-6-methoxyphenol hydroxylase
LNVFPSHVDLLIVGGGPVGGALALALRDEGARVMVVEARAAPASDVRALALSTASTRALAQLGADVDAVGTPIQTVHVSQAGSFGRVVLDARDLGLAMLGQVVPYCEVSARIHGALCAAPVDYRTATTVQDLKTLDGYAVATLAHAGATYCVTAGLVVLAEGGRLLKAVGLEAGERDYAQQAVLAEVTTDRPHGGRAWERFAADGPIALLPLRGTEPRVGRLTVVWTRPAEDPLAVARMDDAEFLAALQARIGERAGYFQSVGPRAAYPLKLRWARHPVGRRVAVVGNAAQTLHPVAGQGLNLGLRDALTLARVLRGTAPAVWGQADTLARYAALRGRDSATTIGVTDGLIRLFDLEMPLVQSGRAVGLAVLDTLPLLRRAFTERMVFGSV